MKHAIALETDGTIRTVVLDEASEYDELVKLVGGYLEAVTLRNGHTLWVNEEGKIQRLPYNRTAQAVFDHNFGPGVDIILGNAVIMGDVDEDGNTLGLTEEELAMYVGGDS